MSVLLVRKEVAILPAILAPDTIYAVRVGTGFDLYISDSTGAVAHKQNASAPDIGVNIAIGSGVFAL